MIIYKIKRFSQRKYKYINRIGKDYNNHYTVPNNIARIMKDGLIPRKEFHGISTWKSSNDVLYGENINKLNETNLESSVGTRKLPNIKSLNDIKEKIKSNPTKNTRGETVPDFIKEAQKHLVKHGKTSYLYNPSAYKGTTAKKDNPADILATMDGLHHGFVGKNLRPQEVSFRKTRNPIRISIDSLGMKKQLGSDAGMTEEELMGKISPNKLKVEIPNSGVGTRDSDIKHLRRYLKGHKKYVNATRETMEALYGSKYPHLDRFPSEK